MGCKCGSQIILCNLPVRFDTYRGCSHGCRYCFAQKKNDISHIERDESVDGLRSFIEGKRGNETEWCDWNIPIHWGGMSDPFQPVEKQIHASAKELAAQENSFIVQYGINIIGYGDTLLTAVAAQTENLPDDIENLVMTCGSGITATGVMIGLHRYGKRVKRMHLVELPRTGADSSMRPSKRTAQTESLSTTTFSTAPDSFMRSPQRLHGGAFACILITRQRRCSGLEAPASHRKAPYSGLRARSLAARDRAESEERRTMPNRTKDDLWERQPGESAQAYEAFAIYRDMGSNRSLRVVAEQLSKSDTLIKRWSREKKWGERCRAYDNHLDDVARQEALRKYKKMRTRHIGIALQLQEKALAELKNLPDGSMTPKDIIQFLDKATELERDNRMEEAGVTAGGKTAEEQEETTLSLADEIAAAYENRKRGEQT